MLASKSTKVTISLDCMGGDNAPFVVVAGADRYLRKDRRVRFLLHGDKIKINGLLEEFPALKEVSTVHHTSDSISDEEKPSVAVRRGLNSSMRLAINSVKKGEADAIVSSGNTGALMAMSKIVLRTLESIDRPAIVTFLPNKEEKFTVFLDMGANLECDSNNLCQFTIMGRAFCRAVLNVKNPTIGILNVGSEDLKGVDSVKHAAAILRESVLSDSFYGYVEGNDVVSGVVDVVVTDGFSGNIALKAIEGTAKFFASTLKKSFKKSILAQLGYIFVKGALDDTTRKLDPRLYNGGMFVGLNGIVVKSHGNTDEIGFANAIKVAVSLVRDKINEKIVEEIKNSNFDNELEQYIDNVSF